MKVVCYNRTCRYNIEGVCSRGETRIDELGMCIDSRVITQYPQEKLRRASKPKGARGK